MQGEKLNPELDILVGQKKISEIKMKELIFLKKFIDRLSKKPFISKQKLKDIEEKLGTIPDIITWGDYFQAEVATEHYWKTDHEFCRVIQTIIYDIIVSAIIFCQKDKASMEEFKKQKWISQVSVSDDSFESRNEQEYFNILFVYFEEMGLDLSLLEAEKELALKVSSFFNASNTPFRVCYTHPQSVFNFQTDYVSQSQIHQCKKIG